MATVNFTTGLLASLEAAPGGFSQIAANFTTSQVDADGNALVGSNTIKDVFYYDTTRDSDGGAWRNNASAQTKSWYTEAFGTTRGKKKEFPEKAYIVATSTTVDIIDAVENKLWMRFSKGATTTQQMIGQTTNSVPSSVFALNGEIFVGCNGTVGELFAIKFITDTAKKYNATDDYDSNVNIANRNTTVTWASGTATPIVNTIVNDVHAAVISGKTYVAVATDGGVSVINETDGTVVNIYPASNKATKSIQIVGSSLYYTRGAASTTADTLVAYYTIPAISDTTEANKSASYTSATTPAIVALTTSYLTNLYVTAGTSIVDGTSNTIYLATTGRMTVLQEKASNTTPKTILPKR